MEEYVIVTECTADSGDSHPEERLCLPRTDLPVHAVAAALEARHTHKWGWCPSKVYPKYIFLQYLNTSTFGLM